MGVAAVAAAGVRRHRRDDPALPEVFTRSDAAAVGLGRHHCATRVSAGEWVVLRAGVFCLGRTWRGADARHRLLLRTLALGLGRSSVISHLSAAAVFDWWLPLEPSAGHLPWTTRSPSAGASARRGSTGVEQVADLPGGDLVRWARPGLPALRVTAPARTAVDCARHLPLHESLPLLDAAARAGVTRADVERVLADQVGWAGSARARRAVRRVDPLRESWLESVGAAVLADGGAPNPVSQAVVRTSGGRFVARVDHAWPELGVVAEADGWGKYGDDPASVLRAEKRREDALRDLGLEVIRYEARDVVRGGRATSDVLVRRLDAARGRADPRRTTAVWELPRPTPGW